MRAQAKATWVQASICACACACASATSTSNSLGSHASRSPSHRSSSTPSAHLRGVRPCSESDVARSSGKVPRAVRIRMHEYAYAMRTSNSLGSHASRSPPRRSSSDRRRTCVKRGRPARQHIVGRRTACHVLMLPARTHRHVQCAPQTRSTAPASLASLTKRTQRTASARVSTTTGELASAARDPEVAEWRGGRVKSSQAALTTRDKASSRQTVSHDCTHATAVSTNIIDHIADDFRRRPDALYRPNAALQIWIVSADAGVKFRPARRGIKNPARQPPRHAHGA